ncbi:histidinol-phosphate transaminase [Deltaproteobacteria bacterium OttesenSCG-928-K17]|nr:histidinol-phosphate transaminase [Deltaproteobacteria bacterium OttesenSCG-928-K17]
MTKIIPDHIANLSPYVPGRLIEEVEAELGLSGIIKLASNENNLGPSPLAVKAVAEALTDLHRYSDADARSLKNALSLKLGYPPECIVTGNGSSEFILVLCHLLLAPGLKAVMSRPSFTLYAKNAQAAGAKVVEIPLTGDYGHDLTAMHDQIDENTRLVFLDNPLNPTGAWLEPEALADFHDSLPKSTVLVIDEAYVEFARRPRPDWRKRITSPGRLVVMRTFSKAYGLAGLRVAYGFMSPELAGAVNKTRQPFNMSLLAQAGALAALEDTAFLEKTLKTTWDSLDFFQADFSSLGLKPQPTEANFMMVDLMGRQADDVFQALLRQGVITRSLTSFGLPGHLRVSAGLPEESRALAEALRKVL